METRAVAGTPADPIDAAAFKLEVTELRELMELRTDAAVNAIAEIYGGVANLCQGLFTSEQQGLWQPFLFQPPYLSFGLSEI